MFDLQFTPDLPGPQVAHLQLEHGSFVVERHVLRHFDQQRTGETYGYCARFRFIRPDGARVQQYSPDYNDWPGPHLWRLEQIEHWMAGVYSLSVELYYPIDEEPND